MCPVTTSLQRRSVPDPIFGAARYCDPASGRHAVPLIRMVRAYYTTGEGYYEICLRCGFKSEMMCDEGSTCMFRRASGQEPPWMGMGMKIPWWKRAAATIGRMWWGR